MSATTFLALKYCCRFHNRTFENGIKYELRKKLFRLYNSCLWNLLFLTFKTFEKWWNFMKTINILECFIAKCELNFLGSFISCCRANFLNFSCRESTSTPSFVSVSNFRCLLSALYVANHYFLLSVSARFADADNHKSFYKASEITNPIKVPRNVSCKSTLIKRILDPVLRRRRVWDK